MWEGRKKAEKEGKKQPLEEGNELSLRPAKYVLPPGIHFWSADLIPA